MHSVDAFIENEHPHGTTVKDARDELIEHWLV